VATPWIILSEGDGDEAFFRHLIAARGIPNVEALKRPKTDDPEKQIPEGNSGFGKWLKALVPLTGINTHGGILIASDNDSNPAESFKLIRKQIKSAKVYGVPGAPEQIKASPGDMPPVAVLMLPEVGELGCLETLCLKAAFAKRRKMARCIKTYLECIGTDGWTPSNLSKLRLRCLLAGACKRSPNTGLQYAWSAGRPKDLILLNHRCFNRVADFLAKLTQP
jgi:hypothetical protein